MYVWWGMPRPLTVFYLEKLLCSVWAFSTASLWPTSFRQTVEMKWELRQRRCKGFKELLGKGSVFPGWQGYWWGGEKMKWKIWKFDLLYCTLLLPHVWFPKCRTCNVRPRRPILYWLLYNVELFYIVHFDMFAKLQGSLITLIMAALALVLPPPVLCACTQWYPSAIIWFILFMCFKWFCESLCCETGVHSKRICQWCHKCHKIKGHSVQV